MARAHLSPRIFGHRTPRLSRSKNFTPKIFALLFLLFFGLFFFRWNGQTKHRELPYAADVHSTCVFRVRQIKRLAKFAAIDFRIGSPRFLHASALSLEHIGRIEPAFKWPPQNFPLSFFSLQARGPVFLILTLWLGSCGTSA